MHTRCKQKIQYDRSCSQTDTVQTDYIPTVGDVNWNNRQNSLSSAVHIQANLEDDLVKEALRTVSEAHHNCYTNTVHCNITAGFWVISGMR